MVIERLSSVMSINVNIYINLKLVLIFSNTESVVLYGLRSHDVIYILNIYDFISSRIHLRIITRQYSNFRKDNDIKITALPKRTPRSILGNANRCP